MSVIRFYSTDWCGYCKSEYPKVEKIAAKLREWGGGSVADVDLPPAGDHEPAASTDDREYERALNQDWRKLSRSIRKGTTEQKLEKCKKFLTDFPLDNPYADKVRKAMDALEAERKAAAEKARRLWEVKQPGTNLYWLGCPIGQRWSGSSCEGDARRMSWHDAGNACPSGYRLPTRQEFVSLLGGKENSCSKSSKCSSMFGGDRRSYWSSSSYAADSSHAWGVRFGNGRVDYYAKGNGRHVRCVRGGP